MKKLFLTIVLGAILTIPIGGYGTVREQDWSTTYAAIGYTGMVNQGVFSIRSDNSRTAVNLYYPTTTNVISYSGERVAIIKVTPEYLKVKRLTRSK